MNVIIHGCRGKMGIVVAESVLDTPGTAVAFGVDRDVEQGDAALRGPSDFPVLSLDDCPDCGDVIIDFSSHDAVTDLMAFAISRRLPVVIATTGLSGEEQDAVDQAALAIPVFQSPNFSIGINLLAACLEILTPALEKEFDIGIIDKHHRGKKDAPSGTAILLGKTVENASPEHKKAEIVALRLGTIPGEHTVVFAGPGEVIELKHTAQSRQVFAQGAVRAAAYLMDKPPGLYSMQHLLKGLDHA